MVHVLAVRIVDWELSHLFLSGGVLPTRPRSISGLDCPLHRRSWPTHRVAWRRGILIASVGSRTRRPAVKVFVMALCIKQSKNQAGPNGSLKTSAIGCSQFRNVEFLRWKKPNGLKWQWLSSTNLPNSRKSKQRLFRTIFLLGQKLLLKYNGRTESRTLICLLAQDDTKMVPCPRRSWFWSEPSKIQ
jgi:hypothetical protein